MKISILLFALASLSICGISQESSFYKLSTKTNDGKEFSFEQLRGKKVIISNTATRCSLSNQFHAYQELHEKYGDKGLVILAFPTNDFGRREPGNDESIRSVCDRRFGITFPIMAKSTIIGKEMNPVFQWLTQKDKNGFKESEVRWNYQKFFINEKGELVEILEPLKKIDGDFTKNWLSK